MWLLGTYSQNISLTSNWVITTRLLFLFVSDICGTVPFGMAPEARIIGGTVARRGAWPWQVSFQFLDDVVYTMYCGGCIITNYWVLTAAHCFNGKLSVIHKWRVVAGVHNIKHPEATIQISNISLKSNWSFDAKLRYHDIAVVRLATPVAFNNFVQPICMTTDYSRLDFLNCHISGWGVTTTSRWNAPSEMLRTHVFQPWCGDSGGPLQCSDKTGNYYLVGITSFGRGCAEKGSPGIYTRVSNYKDWVDDFIKAHPVLLNGFQPESGSTALGQGRLGILAMQMLAQLLLLLDFVF
uniref:Peptidase S1 domain-containing protein n=1 Tax=Erpetoichthys calabaricus TaxID=27687 RepID=A0A8C4RGN0_ERPCA